MKFISLTIIFLTFFSCSGVSRNDVESIKILEKKDLSKCQAIDVVEGTNDKGIESLALAMAKLKAYKLDANSLFVQETVTNGSNIKIIGTVYSCK